MEQLPSPSNTCPPLTGSVANRVLMETVFQLFRQIQAGSTKSEVITDHHLLTLHSIFQQQLLLQALDLVDQDRVTSCTCSEEGRDCSVPWEKAVCLVKGSSDKEYVCCVSSSSSKLHCSCPSFVYSVKVRKEAIMCKHLLAACLAMALCRDSYVTVTKDRWEELWDIHHTH